MKIIFREGQKAYDQINFPDLEGKVISIDLEEDPHYPMEVQFKDKENTIHVGHYSLSGFIFKGESSFPTLSTSPYKLILEGFEQKEQAPTYDDVRLDSLKKGDYVSITKHLELPNERLMNAFEALAKLIWLRDYYNEGWQPNWKNNNEDKYVILTQNDDIECQRNCSYRRTLAFKTKEIRDKFLEEQRELLEIAKHLL